MHCHEIIITAAAVTAWCSLHSLLVSLRVAKAIKKKGGVYQGLYRIFYNIFSAISLIPILAYTATSRQDIIFAWEGGWRAVQIPLIFYALVMFYRGSSSYNSAAFLGLQQWRNYRAGKRQKANSFSDTGILQIVRHPWYSGGIAFIWAMGPVTDVNLASRLIFTIYLIIGAKLEERKMALDFRETYRKYRQSVPMFIPDLPAILRRKTTGKDTTKNRE